MIALFVRFLEFRLRRPGSLALKRLVDLLLAGVFLLLFAPLYLLVGLLVFLESGPQVIYCQMRLGKGGRPFGLYKFRTMHQRAETALEELLLNDPQARAEYQKYRKMRNDPRITRLGRFMRSYSLDELPQIVNVLRGELSLVGPRPYLPEEIDPHAPEGRKILSVTPGITGWWQVMGRNEATFQERLELDQYYVEHWSAWMDICILVKTPWVVLNGSGR